MAPSLPRHRWNLLASQRHASGGERRRRPPILVGERQGVGVVMTGSFGLLVLSLLLSVFLPSMQQPGNGIRSSNHSYSSAGPGGPGHLRVQGCATCHTQLIRNVVTDVGLGPVTPRRHQPGHRIPPRSGPTWRQSAAGSKTPPLSWPCSPAMETIRPPPVSSEADLVNLVAYLRESR